jgi:mRNA-degrading endonuclease RelE of RelBE toxin-antitoxin system
MNFILNFTPSAEDSLKKLKTNTGLKKHYKALVKNLNHLKNNPKHPGLQSHLYHSLKGPKGEKIFEVYAEQNTPAAYRIFFYYGPKKGQIIVWAIIKHPGN